MFMLRSTHAAAMKAKDAEIAHLRHADDEMCIIGEILDRQEFRSLPNMPEMVRAALVQLEEMRTFNFQKRQKILTLEARLAAIAAMETPACASIGKRMAAVARGETALQEVA